MISKRHRVGAPLLRGDDVIRSLPSLGLTVSEQNRHLSYSAGTAPPVGVFKIQVDGLFELGDRLIYSFTEARDVNVETLGHEILAFPVQNSVSSDRLPPLTLVFAMDEGLVISIDAR